jgi:hypothetical protein
METFLILGSSAQSCVAACRKEILLLPYNDKYCPKDGAYEVPRHFHFEE